MPSFAVSFDPEIPRDGALRPPAEPNWSAIFVAFQRQDEINVTFTLCHERFCYYPANPCTVLGDLLWEIDKLDAGDSHDISLCGYTILVAAIEGGKVVFADPNPKRNWRCEAVLADVRSALVAASNDLWTFIVSRKPQLSA